MKLCILLSVFLFNIELVCAQPNLNKSDSKEGRDKNGNLKLGGNNIPRHGADASKISTVDPNQSRYEQDMKKIREKNNRKVIKHKKTVLKKK